MGTLALRGGGVEEKSNSLATRKVPNEKPAMGQEYSKGGSVLVEVSNYLKSGEGIEARGKTGAGIQDQIWRGKEKVLVRKVTGFKKSQTL